MKKPMRAAQTMLKMISFHTIAATVEVGIILRTAVSKLAVPTTAMAKLTSRRPQNFKERSIDGILH
jgi:hypothetical protein